MKDGKIWGFPSSSDSESPERRLLREALRAMEWHIGRFSTTTAIRALLAQPEGQNNAAGQEARLPDVGDVARVERPAAILSGGTQTAPVPAAPSEKVQRVENLDEANEIIRVLKEELAAICVAVGRSKDGTGFDVDWYNLQGDVRAFAASARLTMPTASEIRLAAGELTAGEMRTAKAVLAWFIRRADKTASDKGQG